MRENSALQLCLRSPLCEFKDQMNHQSIFKGLYGKADMFS